MRFVTQYPGHPWWNLCVALVEELAGAAQGTAPVSQEAYARRTTDRFGLLTPSEGMMGALCNPPDVARGVAEVGMTTPTATATMAREGAGPYDRSYDGLRAIAAYPHDDFLIFLADARHGVDTLRDYLALSVERTVVTGRVSPRWGPDVLTHCVTEVMRAHAGADLGTIAGLRVQHGGPTRAAGQVLLEGRADALFHEAQGHPMWGRIAEQRDMVVLEPDAELLDVLGAELGLERRDIPAGHQVGNERDVPTLDFSGWLLVADERLADADAYALAMACDRSRGAVEAIIPDRSIVKPLDPTYLFTHTGVPLHDGAARYARDAGHV